ncbi:MAG: sensor histidine kinase, partial [Actinomycetales bacterium]
GTAALVQAAREAMLNAVRHAGTAVSVYIEAGPASTDIFIKDRGPGFDQAAIGADRLGVRESIVGRMKRHGGSAAITSGPGGTEVALSLPVRPAAEPRAAELHATEQENTP